jgi:hypothetical protein
VFGPTLGFGLYQALFSCSLLAFIFGFIASKALEASRKLNEFPFCTCTIH